MSGFDDNISLTCSDAEITVRRWIGRMQRAKAWTVVPEAMIIESSRVISLAAALPMAIFCDGMSFSFSLTVRFEA